MQDSRASLPAPIREWIVEVYPAWVIAAVDRAGRTHDYYMKSERADWKKWNNLMILELYQSGVPLTVRIVIRFGLFIYWHSPAWAQRLFFKTVPKT